MKMTNKPSSETTFRRERFLFLLISVAAAGLYAAANLEIGWAQVVLLLITALCMLAALLQK